MIAVFVGKGVRRGSSKEKRNPRDSRGKNFQSPFKANSGFASVLALCLKRPLVVLLICLLNDDV